GAGLGEELALRPEHMARTPEADAARAERRRLVSDPVAAQYRQPVRDRVAAVAQDPGPALAILLVLRVVRVPADRGRIEQQFGAGQRHQARGFGIPLVPADEDAEAADRAVDRFEAEVAGREVELLV